MNDPVPVETRLQIVLASGRRSKELKLALAEATVQLRIWQKGSEFVDQVPSQTSRR